MSERDLMSFMDASADELEEFLRGATLEDGQSLGIDRATSIAQPVASLSDDRRSRDGLSSTDRYRFGWQRADDPEPPREPATKIATDERPARYDRSPTPCRKSRRDDRKPSPAGRYHRAADWGRENDGDRHGKKYSRQKDSSSDRTPSLRREVKPSLADHRSTRREASSKGRSASRQRNVSTTRERYGYAVGAKLSSYNGSTCLETFLARFKNCARYFN